MTMYFNKLNYKIFLKSKRDTFNNANNINIKETLLTLAFVSVNISNAFESSRNNSTALGLSGFLSG